MHPTARHLMFSRTSVIVTSLAAFFLVLGSVALSSFSGREIRAGDRRAAAAQQALAVVNQLLATVNEAETAQRGYLLTGEARYLAPYEAALPRYQEEVASLRRQFKGEAHETATVQQLADLCDERFAEIARTVQLVREQGTVPAKKAMETDDGWRTMVQIREHLHALQREQLAAIASHSVAAQDQANTFENMNRALLALATLLGAIVTWTVIRRVGQLEEGLIKVCAWTQRVEWEGQWVTFEDYLEKRFGIHCTHGISDQAAKQMELDIENTSVPPE